MDDGDFDEFDEFDRGGFDADLNEEWEAMEAAHEASKEKPVEPEPEPELVPAPPVIAVAAPPPPPPAPKPKPSIGVYAVPPQGKLFDEDADILEAQKIADKWSSKPVSATPRPRLNLLSPERPKAPEDIVAPVVDSENVTLWVDKYAPRVFTDLLSPETINRNVATWLKGWMNDIEGHAPASHATSAPAGYTNYWNNSAKILLLCGPPGLGKTTLAHVLCSHCGFRPDEVNASDDRSAPALRSRVLAAMQSVFGDKKPVCLVLDEVDGLTSEAVEELVKIIRATPDRGATSKSSDAAYRASATGDGGDGSDNEDAPSALAGKGGKKKQARRVEPQQTLRRPVICICNDMYAPSVRLLREYAQVVTFPKPPVQKLVTRLKEICAMEGMHVNSDALLMLCEMAGNDIRTCLNSLQFIRKQTGRGTVRITPHTIAAACVGQKDLTKGLFDIWDSVFTLHEKRGAKRVLAHAGLDSSKNTWDRFAPEFGSHDSQMLWSGVHHNFPRSRYRDPLMAETSRCLDWLTFADVCSSRANSHQQFVLNRYTPAAVCAIHETCKSQIRFKVEFPREDRELFREQDRRKKILAAFLQGRITGMIGHGHAGARDSTAAVVDMLSSFVRIVCPPLRPVNFELLTGREKADVESVLGVLMSASATFRPVAAEFGRETSDDLGGMKYRLDPEVELLVDFEGQPFMEGQPVMSDVVKKIIAAEVRKAIVRRSRQHASTSGDGGDIEMGGDDAHDPTLSNMPQHILNQIGKGVRAPVKAIDPALAESTLSKSKSFLASVKTAGAAEAVVRVAPRTRYPVYYKFQEGHTNAVRHPMKMSELM